MTTPSKEFKQFIAQKAFTKWADANQMFIEDLQALIYEMMMFEVKYGTHILYEIDKNPKEHFREIKKNLEEVIKMT